MKKILLVEDALEFRTIVQRTLEKDYELVQAPTLDEARKCLERGPFDLVILDVMLPDGDGMELCRLLQADPVSRRVPIIVLTGKSEVTDKINAFALGADDYLVKPFHPLELKARVEARLAKAIAAAAPLDTVAKGNIRLHIPTQRVEIEESGAARSLDLTPIEFKLLLFFLKNEEKVYPREELITYVWGDGVHVIQRTVDAHVSNMRKKIRGSEYTIKSVHGVGYRLARDIARPKAVAA